MCNICFGNEIFHGRQETQMCIMFMLSYVLDDLRSMPSKIYLHENHLCVSFSPIIMFKRLQKEVNSTLVNMCIKVSE